jgi:hypothetical protein
MRPLISAVAIGSMALLTCGNAVAVPVAPVDGAALEPNLVLVRDGCGRGMRFSNRLQACVEDFDDGYRQGPPLRYYGQDGPPPPPLYYRDDVYRRAPAPAPVIPPCPPGQRFSYSRQACVWTY